MRYALIREYVPTSEIRLITREYGSLLVCFHLSLVSILFTGSSLHPMNFWRKFFSLVYTVFPRIVIAITFHFRYLPSATTKRGVNKTRVIAIKLSKTNPPKNNRNKGQKFFLEKMFTCRDEPIKTMETRPRRKHTRRLPHYGNMVEKKDMKTTLHLLHVRATDAG